MYSSGITLSHVKVILCAILLVCRWKYLNSKFFFSSHFCFLLIGVLLIFILPVYFSGLLLFVFLCCFFLNPRIDAYSLSTIVANPLLPPFPTTYSISYLSDLHSYASSLAFLSSGQFVKVYPSSILRIISCVSTGGQSRCLSF